MRRAFVAIATLVFAAGCSDEPDLTGQNRAVRSDLGVDVADIERCLGCHEEVRGPWSQGSSHALIFDCRSCHAPISNVNPEAGGRRVAPEAPEGAGTAPDIGGPGHAARPACASCHSDATHQGLACTGCHEPHGSPNLFSVRVEIISALGTPSPVRLSLAEGISRFGFVRGSTLARAGERDGLCEVCHASTSYYRRSGGGRPHSPEYCTPCHGHAGGFAPRQEP